MGGGHRNPHYIEHFLKESFFDQIQSTFLRLRSGGGGGVGGRGGGGDSNDSRERSHIELLMRPVGASPENVLKLVIYRSSMGEVLYYWD